MTPITRMRTKPCATTALLRPLNRRRSTRDVIESAIDDSKRDGTWAELARLRLAAPEVAQP